MITRPHGRGVATMRELEISMGELERAHGSARVKQGNTEVLVACFGPIKAYTHKQAADQPKGTHIQVEVKWGEANNSPLVNHAHTFATSLLKRILERQIVKKEYTQQTIDIVVQVIANDGSLAAAIINATTLALMDAGIAMQSPFIAVAFTKEGCIDPEKTEEKTARGVMTVVMDPISTGTVAIEQSAINPFIKSACVVSDNKMIALARMAIPSIHDMMRQVMKHHLQHTK